MKLKSFDRDLRQLFMMIGSKYGPFIGDIRFVATVTSQAYEWLDNRLPSDLLFTTVDEAIGSCTADRGDVIIVAPNHAENLAAADAIDADVAGISIIGLGNGGARPTFTYTNAAGEFVIGADNIRVSNMIFNAAVTTVLKGIDIETGSEWARIEDCFFGVNSAGTDEFNNAIVIGDQANHSVITRCQCHQGTAAAVAFVFSDADNDYAEVSYCFSSGDYSEGNIHGDEADDMVWYHHNTFYNGQATGIGLNAKPNITIAGTTTGVIEHNLCICNLATKAAAIVAADCHLHENYYNEDESSAATSGIIGAASADDE